MVWFPDLSYVGGAREGREMLTARGTVFLPSPLSPRPHRKGLGTKLGGVGVGEGKSWGRKPPAGNINPQVLCTCMVSSEPDPRKSERGWGGSVHCGMLGILLIAESCKVCRVFC